MTHSYYKLLKLHSPSLKYLQKVAPQNMHRIIDIIVSKVKIWEP